MLHIAALFKVCLLFDSLSPSKLIGGAVIKHYRVKTIEKIMARSYLTNDFQKSAKNNSRQIKQDIIAEGINSFIPSIFQFTKTKNNVFYTTNG